MAVYIDDSGAFGYDALISGVENTDWSRDTTNQILWMKTSSGSSDTGFILPMTSSWLLIEVYDVGTTGDGAGVSGQLGRTEWKSGTTDATQTALNAFRTALPASYAYYKIKATEYSGTAGTDAADVWEADNTTAFGTVADYTANFTPSTSSWKITDTLIAPTEAVGATDIYSYLSELTDPGDSPEYTVTNGNNDINAVGDNTGIASGLAFYVWVSPAVTQNSSVDIKFTASLNSGSYPVITTRQWNTGDDDVTDYQIVAGVNTISMPADTTGGSSYARLYLPGNATYDFDMTAFEVLETI